MPQFETRKQPTEVVFLIHCSGSMGGQSSNLAKEELQLFLHSLPVHSLFNIFRFGSSFKQLFPNSVKFEESSISIAQKMVESLAADLGGTEILHPNRSR